MQKLNAASWLLGFEGIREPHLHRATPCDEGGATGVLSIRRSEVERGHVSEVFEMELDAVITVFRYPIHGVDVNQRISRCFDLFQLAVDSGDEAPWAPLYLMKVAMAHCGCSCQRACT